MQLQQPRTFSLDRRRGTLAGAVGGGGGGGDKAKRTPSKGGLLLVKNILPVAAVVAGALVVVAAAFFFFFAAVVARQSPSDDPPSPFFFEKFTHARGPEHPNEPPRRADLRGGRDGGGGTGTGMGPGTAAEDGDATAGLDPEAWRVRVQDSHAAKFRLADPKEPEQGHRQRQKRRISDALKDLHQKKKEEMLRAIEERIGEQKREATRHLLHRPLPR